MREVASCREAYPQHYIQLNAFDASLGRETTALSFIVNRPTDEPGFRLTRAESHGRVVRYTLQPYVVDRPEGERYQTAHDRRDR